MNPHPVEALLRPPVELWSALVAAATGTMAVLAPWALMVPPGVAHATAAALFTLAGIRSRQAWRVIRYQRNMRRLPSYRLRADRIPLSRHKLFLGRGFRWTQRHTQRLRDTIRPEVQHYLCAPGGAVPVGEAQRGCLGSGAPTQRGCLAAAPTPMVESAQASTGGGRQASDRLSGGRYASTDRSSVNSWPWALSILGPW